MVRSVFGNLHPSSSDKNIRLTMRVKKGEFPHFITAYEICPERWFALKEKLLQREQGNKSRAPDQFKCRHCQKRECTYYEFRENLILLF